MPTRADWRRVSLGELVLAPERYAFSWPGEGDAPLRESLARFGQLRPLVVLGGAAHQGGPVLAAGHRRAAALGALGEDTAWARVLVLPFGEPGTDPPELWDLLLEDHLAARPLNPAELGLYVRRRTAGTGESFAGLPPQLFRRLGLPPRSGALEDYLWISELPAVHRDAFALGRLPLAGVRVLLRAPREDALALLDLVGASSKREGAGAGAAVGVNKLSEIARWALECAWGEGLSLAAWAEREGLWAFAGEPEALRAQVRRRRYPELSAWEADFREDSRGLGLPPEARVSHAPGFEGGRLTCTVSFASLPELGRSLDALEEGLRAGRLDRLGRYLG
ncbi:MAG: hypothetical protein AB1578_12375 [Thermodesulfobacteriota bacterium]